MTNTSAPAPPATWRSRVTRSTDEPPDQLLAHPDNWRIHPWYQQQALAHVIERVGVLAPVIVNDTTGHLVDGHLRVLLALRSEQPTIRVDHVELSPEEEAAALATLDTIADMAEIDATAYRQLLEDCQVDHAAAAPHLDTLRSHLLDPATAPRLPHSPGIDTIDHIAAAADTEPDEPAILQVTLAYDPDTYREVIDLADRAGRVLELETHAEAIVAVVGQAAAAIGPEGPGDASDAES